MEDVAACKERANNQYVAWSGIKLLSSVDLEGQLSATGESNLRG